MTRYFCDHCGKELNSRDGWNQFVIRFGYSPNCPIGTDQIAGILCQECTLTVIHYTDAEERRKRMMDRNG